MTTVELQLAASVDLDVLETMVASYHAFENISLDPASRRHALKSLLDDEHFGRIWTISSKQQTVGYIALCFGYSIEFAGRDAFVDEFFILEDFRGQGVGRSVLGLIAKEAAALGIAALHLEVAKDNHRAANLYASRGFEVRDKYRLMTRHLGRH
jgi:ribosomal protein S18 acetylase RimI-like enzyme